MSANYCTRGGVPSYTPAYVSATGTITPIVTQSSQPDAGLVARRISPTLTVIEEDLVPPSVARLRVVAVPVPPIPPVVVLQPVTVIPRSVTPTLAAVRSPVRRVPPPIVKPIGIASVLKANSLTREAAEIAAARSAALGSLPPYVRLKDLGLTIFSSDAEIGARVRERVGKNPAVHLVFQLKGGKAVPLAQLRG